MDSRLAESRYVLYATSARILQAVDRTNHHRPTGILIDDLEATVTDFEEALERDRRGEQIRVSEECIVRSADVLVNVMRENGKILRTATENKHTEALTFAMGAYVGNETRLGDDWRDQSTDALAAELERMVAELQDSLDSDESDELLHAAVDTLVVASQIRCKYAALRSQFD